jgi:uracil-DNA glycosylase family 4
MTRCPTCPYPGAPLIEATGPTPCPIMLIGAGPGKSEGATGLAYSGRAGEELDNLYLPLAGFHREDVYVTNAVQCYSGQEKTPSDKVARACSLHHLPRTIDLVQPEVIVLMGGVPNHLAEPRIRVDFQHGVPIKSELLGWKGWIFSSFEPALGMRDTSKMSQLQEDFTHLGEWVKGEWKPPVSLSTQKDYKLVDSPVDFAFGPSNGVWHRKVKWCAVDTEKHGSEPWSVQWSQKFGQGRIVRATDTESLALLQALLPTVEVILHNAPGDLDTLDKLGIHITNWRDTMQESFNLCSLPQGLKALTYRLFGVTMTSWEDTVWPASVDAVLIWIADAISLSESSLADTVVSPLKRGRCADCGHQHSRGKCKCGCQSTRLTMKKVEHRPGAAESILRHVLQHTGKTMEEEEPYNPWKALDRMKVEGLRGKKAEGWEWEYLEQELGPVPILGIGNCDIDSAVTYAAGDADFTGQVAVELARRRQDDRWRIAEEDRDV